MPIPITLAGIFTVHKSKFQIHTFFFTPFFVVSFPLYLDLQYCWWYSLPFLLFPKCLHPFWTMLTYLALPFTCTFLASTSLSVVQHKRKWGGVQFGRLCFANLTNESALKIDVCIWTWSSISEMNNKYINYFKYSFQRHGYLWSLILRRLEKSDTL